MGWSLVDKAGGEGLDNCEVNIADFVVGLGDKEGGGLPEYLEIWG